MKLKRVCTSLCILVFLILIPTISIGEWSTGAERDNSDNWEYKLYVIGRIKNYTVHQWDIQLTIANGFMTYQTKNKQMGILFNFCFVHNHFIVIPWDNTLQGFRSDHYIAGCFTVYNAPFLTS